MLIRHVVSFLCIGGALCTASPVLRAQASTAPAVTAADIRFMQEMIGHHQQAVEMTALVATRTRRAQLNVLAERISVSQADEIAMMHQWLRTRGADTVSAHDMSAHAGHDMAAAPLMPGMLSAREMAALRGARGARFDRLFLEGMIRHHGGALTMVEQLLATAGAAQESSINRFVTDVDTDQRAEIRRMRQMLDAR